MNSDVKKVIEKWYKTLGFSNKHDQEFYSALNTYDISADLTVDSYDLSCKDGLKNLLYFLYFCEETQNKYKELKVSSDILIDTLKDICIWTDIWSSVKGSLCLFELAWLKLHLKAKLFKIGRLEYYMASAERDIDSLGVKKGDNIIEIHIPSGEKLTTHNCKASITLAKEFFKKHFTSYEYKCFTCHSWLLDETLNKYLSSNSGIIKFSSLFDKVYSNESYSILKYVISWDTTTENLIEKTPVSSFATSIKQAVLNGEKFYETLGYIKK